MPSDQDRPTLEFQQQTVSGKVGAACHSIPHRMPSLVLYYRCVVAFLVVLVVVVVVVAVVVVVVVVVLVLVLVLVCCCCYSIVLVVDSKRRSPSSRSRSRSISSRSISSSSSSSSHLTNNRITSSLPATNLMTSKQVKSPPCTAHHDHGTAESSFTAKK